MFTVESISIGIRKVTAPALTAAVRKFVLSLLSASILFSDQLGLDCAIWSYLSW